MIYMNVPADFRVDTLNQFDRLNQKYSDAKISETYGQVSVGAGDMGSGRPADLLPKADWIALENYIAASKKYGIDFNYTMNATCLGNKEFTEQGVNGILSDLQRLYNIGVSSITVALPSLMEIIRSSPFNFEIKASALCQITNVNKAQGYQQLGVNRMVLDESLNRDFDTIKRIREKTSAKIELILNVICHRNCIYRPFHQNQCAHDTKGDQPSSTFYTHRCMLQRFSKAGDILRLGWIRPEDLHLYEKIGIEYFKLQGRHNVERGDPVRAVEAYMKRDFNGNLLELLDLFNSLNSFGFYLDNKKLNGFVDKYYQNKDFCRLDCDSCKYCDNFVDRCIDAKEAEVIRKRAQVYYSECDPVKQSVQKVQMQLTKQDAAMNKDIMDDFNFEF